MAEGQRKQTEMISVLIVDDNVQYAGMLKRILSGAFGFRSIALVEDIDSAYRMLSSDPSAFQLLFIDYNFPDGRTGGDLLERLNRENMLSGRAALLITAEPTVENMKQAAAAGAVGVVAKPFDREELKGKLENACRAICDEGAF